MEFVSEDGSKTRINPGQTRELGRAHGLNSSDKTISRRHLSFFVPRVADDQEDIRAQFEVLGRNPIYVRSDNEVKIFRRFERGEMGCADRFCVSAKNPVWCALRKIENEDGEEGVRRNVSQRELAGNLESGFGLGGVEDFSGEGVDISDIDPVKEFGFVVAGHEFDSYPKKMIRDIKNWDWFLDEPGKDDEYDDEGKRGNKIAKRKRNKGKDEDDDEEWTGEEESQDAGVADVSIDKPRKSRMVPLPKYTTRSNVHAKPSFKDLCSSRKSSIGKKSRDYMDDSDDDDEDETLGGFIVKDDNELDIDEDEDDDLEEEEELVDDEDDDE